jgi:Flp pilus assembly protein TadG
VPFILLLLGIAIDFGRIYYFDLTLRDAAFAGARYGGMNPNDDAGIKNAAIASAPAGTLAATDVTVAGTPPRGQSTALTVTVRYSFQPIVPAVSNLTGGPILLTRSQVDIVK